MPVLLVMVRSVRTGSALSMVSVPFASLTVNCRSYQVLFFTERKLTTKLPPSRLSSVSGLPKSLTHFTGRAKVLPSPRAMVSAASVMAEARPTKALSKDVLPMVRASVAA